MRTTRYRVNLHVYYWQQEGGPAVYHVMHVGMWGQEAMARNVAKGLDYRGLAYAHNQAHPELKAMGKVDVVLGEVTVEGGRDVETLISDGYHPPEREKVAGSRELALELLEKIWTWDGADEVARARCVALLRKELGLPAEAVPIPEPA